MTIIGPPKVFKLKNNLHISYAEYKGNKTNW